MDRIPLTAAAALSLIAGSTHAALIGSYDAATLSSDGSQVTGGLATPATVFAWNVNRPDQSDSDPLDDGMDGTTPSSFNINGVSFQNAQPGGVTLNIPDFAGTDDTTSNDGSYDDGTGIEAVMGSLLVTDQADPGSPGAGTVTISGLTLGQAYRVQMLHHQDINNAGAREMQVFFGDTSGTSTGFFSAGDDTGYITTADFTADASSQLFTLQSVDGTSERAVVNGLVLYTVPEPGSLALLAAGGLCLLKRRR